MTAGVSGGAPRGNGQVQEGAAEVVVWDGAFDSEPGVVDFFEQGCAVLEWLVWRDFDDGLPVVRGLLVRGNSPGRRAGIWADLWAWISGLLLA